MPDPTAKYVVLRDPKTNEILIPKTTALDYEVVDSQPTPPYELNVDADTLQGHPASDFQLAGEGPDLSNYYTKQETYSKAEVNAMTGGPVTPIPAPSSHTPGDIITWDDKEWLVCHYDSANNQVYLIAKDIVDKCYGYAAVSQTAAIQYEKYNMSKGALLQCVPVTNYGITSKVFIPTYNQMKAEEYSDENFSWFNSNARRIAYYNGTATQYWLSCAYNTYWVWGVNEAGGISTSDYGPAYLYGFRPCVCVQL